MDAHADKQATKAEVSCPYCGSPDTEFFSLFGQQLLTVQYYCNACHTPFEHIKDDDVLYEVDVAHVATSF
jgi:DNA-directed RNA polymerase subunit RPC12/RpoP